MTSKMRRELVLALAGLAVLVAAAFSPLFLVDADAQTRNNMGTVPVFSETGVLGPIVLLDGQAVTSGSTHYLDIGTTAANYTLEVAAFCIGGTGLVECDVSASTGVPTGNYPVFPNVEHVRLLPASGQQWLRLRSYHGDNIIWAHLVTE